MLNFGPIYAFWLFGFERYNGLLGNIDTNKKGSFEVTFAKHLSKNTRLQIIFSASRLTSKARRTI